MDATSDSRDWRSRKPEIHFPSELSLCTEQKLLVSCLPYDLLLATIEHHDEDETDHVIAGQALFPPEDCVEQILFQNLIRGWQSGGVCSGVGRPDRPL